MVETVNTFPLPKLRYDKYLTLGVMMHVEYQQVYEFMFAVNKEGRSFIKTMFIIIRNGFINDGLIPFKLEYNFNGIM